jgi:alkaline phosphatase
MSSTPGADAARQSSVSQEDPYHPDAPTPSGSMSRRSLLGASAAGLVGLASLRALGQPVASNPQAAVTPAATARAKNLIWLIADGMSVGSMSVMEDYLRVNSATAPSAWRDLLNRRGTRHGIMGTHSFDSPVTDSAAASSAFSTGMKHRNGSLCVGPDGEEFRPFFQMARANKRRVGAVTTTTITHATPAGFYATIPARRQERDIARQLVDARLDVALGGGSQFFSPELLALAEREGIRVVRTATELQRVDRQSSAPVIGLFNESHLSYAMERRPGEPSLPAMAVWAMERLSQPRDGTDGFVLQIEAGRIDHSEHNNDAGALVQECLEFDATLAAVMRWADARNDTLVVVCSDHATANPGTVVYGSKGHEALRSLKKFMHSFEWVLEPVGREADIAKRVALLASRVKEATGVELDTDAIARLRDAYGGSWVHPSSARRNIVTLLGDIMVEHTGVGFNSGDHTSETVPIIASGPGAESLPGAIDNTDLHNWVKVQTGLTSNA